MEQGARHERGGVSAEHLRCDMVRAEYEEQRGKKGT